jgi:hypothetical protein
VRSEELPVAPFFNWHESEPIDPRDPAGVILTVNNHIIEDDESNRRSKIWM